LLRDWSRGVSRLEKDEDSAGNRAAIFVGQALESVWEVAKIDFHIPFRFPLLLKQLKLSASTKKYNLWKSRLPHRLFSLSEFG